MFMCVCMYKKASASVLKGAHRHVIVKIQDIIIIII